MKKCVLEHVKNTVFAIIFVVLFFALTDAMATVREHPIVLKDRTQIEAQCVDHVKTLHEGKVLVVQDAFSSLQPIEAGRKKMYEVLGAHPQEYIVRLRYTIDGSAKTLQCMFAKDKIGRFIKVSTKEE